MGDDEVALRSILAELVDLFGWSDSTPLHAALHVRSAVLNMRAELAAERARAEKAEANYAFMVERAADQHLGGYRELGARAASAENEADRLRNRLRETAQILVAELGASGPMDAEDAAREAVERMIKLRAVADETAAEAELHARRLEQALVRSRAELAAVERALRSIGLGAMADAIADER
jgi:hypothetical protein